MTTPFRFLCNPGRDLVRSANTVLNGRPRRYHDPGFQTTLSLKSVVRGAAWYETRHTRYRVTPDSVVVLNHGQQYALDVYPRAPTETLAVFFQPGFVEHVAAASAHSAEELLDEPDPAVAPLDFCERSHAVGERLRAALAALHRAIATPGHEPMRLEQPFFSLAEQLLALRGHDRRETEALASLRASTRHELFRRLHHARDYLESCFGDPLSVADLAGIACLSPYHFQRSFREAFGVSPGRYLQRKRLDVAAHLLATTDRAITAIALDVGYTSPGTFSARFRRQHGASPRTWRRHHA